MHLIAIYFQPDTRFPSLISLVSLINLLIVMLYCRWHIGWRHLLIANYVSEHYAWRNRYDSWLSQTLLIKYQIKKTRKNLWDLFSWCEWMMFNSIIEKNVINFGHQLYHLMNFTTIIQFIRIISSPRERKMHKSFIWGHIFKWWNANFLNCSNKLNVNKTSIHHN